MKKILLDTNIVLDIALERGEFYNNAKNIVELLYKNDIPIFITATTVTDIYYILRKDKGHRHTIDFLKSFFDFVNVAGVNKTVVFNALNSSLSAVQVETSKQNNIKIIITRNKKDFASSGLQIFSPDEYINKLKNKN